MQSTSSQVPRDGESDAMMQKLWRGKQQKDEEAGQRQTLWLSSSEKKNQLSAEYESRFPFIS